MPRIDLIQLRGGTAALWASTNPVLGVREPGYETDTGRAKVGDGVTAWNDLPYRFEEGGGSAHPDLAAHDTLGLATQAELDAHATAEAAARAAAIAALVDSSPAALDTLNELAAALADDPNFATTITNLIAGKQPLDDDLTAIAALTTTAYGRSLLAVADAQGGRTALGVRVPQVLDEAESTVAQTTISAVTDLTGLSVTFTVTDLPVYVVLFLPRVAFTADGNTALATIADQSDVAKAFGQVESTRNGALGQIWAIEKITTPGTYTRKARLQRTTGTGTLTNNIDQATTVSRLVATEQAPLAA